MRRPSLKLNATASTVNITELSAFTERGILQATAAVSQLPQRQVNLSFSGRGVPLNILQAWGWPSLPISGDGNLQLTASGSVQADAPLKPTVNVAAQRREYGETAGGANHAQRRGQPRPPPRQRPLPSPHSDAHSLSSMGERDCFPAKLHSDYSPFQERVGVRVLKPVCNTRLSVPI